MTMTHHIIREAQHAAGVLDLQINHVLRHGPNDESVEELCQRAYSYLVALVALSEDLSALADENAIHAVHTGGYLVARVVTAEQRVRKSSTASRRQRAAERLGGDADEISRIVREIRESIDA